MFHPCGDFQFFGIRSVKSFKETGTINVEIKDESHLNRKKTKCVHTLKSYPYLSTQVEARLHRNVAVAFPHHVKECIMVH